MDVNTTELPGNGLRLVRDEVIAVRVAYRPSDRSEYSDRRAGRNGSLEDDDREFGAGLDQIPVAPGSWLRLSAADVAEVARRRAKLGRGG